MKLHLAEALRSCFHGLREHLFRVRFGHVVAVEPGESSRRRSCALTCLHLVEAGAARQQVRLRHARAVEMGEVVAGCGRSMEVQIEDRRAPLVRRAAWRASDGKTAAAVTFRGIRGGSFSTLRQSCASAYINRGRCE